jgi:hypothetical protein
MRRDFYTTLYWYLDGLGVNDEPYEIDVTVEYGFDRRTHEIEIIRVFGMGGLLLPKSMIESLHIDQDFMALLKDAAMNGRTST